jgi:hypothetical protein
VRELPRIAAEGKKPATCEASYLPRFIRNELPDSGVSQDALGPEMSDPYSQLGPNRPLKKLPSVMGMRPVCHEVQRFVEVVVAGLGAQGHAATMSLGSRIRL